METYSFNPNKINGVQPEREKPQPVIDSKPADAKIKKSFGEKLLTLFISDDVKDIKGYLVKQVVVPTIKNTISDVVNMTLGLNGRSGQSSLVGGRLPIERISYGSYYNNQRSQTPTATDRAEARELLFNDRGTAELILQTLDDIIERYGTAKLNDFYDISNRGDLCTVAGAQYGWKSLHAAKVIPVGDKWAIKLPKTFPIN